MGRIMFAVLFSLLLDTCLGQCRMAYWWGGFDSKGWVDCDRTEYVKGLFRNNNQGSNDQIYLLEEGKCCKAPAPNQDSTSTCETANWWGVLDNTNSWAVCPEGHFIQGFFRNDCGWLYCIEEAHCCKPDPLSSTYAHCYDEDVASSFNSHGLSECTEDYYMVGIYKGECDQLHCIEKFRCCRMQEDPGAECLQ